MKSLSLLAFIAGAAFTLAFAPFNVASLGLLIPAFLIFLVLADSVKNAAWVGWLFGVGFFGTAVSWVYISIHTFGGTNAPLAVFLTLLFIGMLALFPMVGFTLFRLLTSSLSLYCSRKNGYLLILFPLTWLFSELLRSWVGGGFPWVLLGYSQLHTPLKGFIPLVGAYGTSTLSAFCSVLIYLICAAASSQRTRMITFLALGLIFAAGEKLSTIQWTTPLPKSLTVSLIQANITQDIKWDPKHFAHILTTYERLTQPELGRNLIVWPEGSVPAPTYYVSDFLAKMDENALNHHSTLLLGTILSDDRQSLYNGMLVLGQSEGSYKKRHLVPFGEYLPFQSLLRGLINFFDIPMSDLTPGSKNQPLLDIDGLFLSPSICFEVAYPELIYNQISQANILINISDDSWFVHSLAAAQQLQIGQVRALETGHPMIVSNNNGITAIISPQGKIIKALPPNQEGVLKATVTGYTNTTPLVKMLALGNHI